MHVNVVIPTFARPKLLAKTVASLRAQTYRDLSIHVIVDGNSDVLNQARGLGVDVYYNRQRVDWVWSMNEALGRIREGAVVYASDDLEFDLQAVEMAVKRLRAEAPDGDALVAITQDVRGCSSAFGILGPAFIKRFPRRAVFCPDYVHYGSDFELGKFARSIGRLYTCPAARVKHHRLKDETYRMAKPVESRDRMFLRMRQERGLLWGASFDLLSERGKRWAG